jgi:hypothetical protein
VLKRHSRFGDGAKDQRKHDPASDIVDGEG